MYRRLFDALPYAEPLFARDATGAVRGEMLAMALQCLLDPEGPFTAGLVRTERVNHDGWGVAPADFPRFYEVLQESCREALGPDWTPAMAADWRRAVDRLLGA